MNDLQLYVEVDSTTGTWQELDLLPSEPIKITSSIEDLVDPTKIPSSYSQSFRVPDTERNNIFFKNAFNVNTDDFDATLKASAYFNCNSDTIISGNVRLVAIYIDQKLDKIEYEIVFLGEVADFSSTIADGYLSDLDLSKYSHVLTYANIKSSWNKQLFSGDIAYPLIEWGYDYQGVTGGAGNFPKQVQMSANPANQWAFTKNTVPSGYPVTMAGLSKYQFKPSISLYAILQIIFQRSGYTWQSSFLGSSFFKNLYLVTDSVARATLEFALNGQGRIGVSNFQQQSISYSNPDINIYFNEVRNDPYQGFVVNNTESYYLVKGDGDYTFHTTSKWSTHYPSTETVMSIKRDSGGVITTLGSQVQTAYSGAIQPIFDITVTSTPLLKGDKIYVYWSWLGGGVGSIGPMDDRYFEVTSSTINLDMVLLMPNDIKISDFVKGIFDRFKLVMVPDKRKSKNFLIEPWRDWINNGTRKDFSNKVDWNQEIQLSPTFYTQNRSMQFLDDEDSDYPNETILEETNKVFGQFDYNSGNQLITDTTKIESIFSPTPINLVFNTTEFYIPNLYKLGSTSSTSTLELDRTAIVPKPRILYYEGIKSSPVVYYMRDDSNIVTGQNTYPKFTYLASLTVDQVNVTLDLNWNNQIPFWARSKPGIDPNEGRTPYSAVSVYWNPFIEEVYNGYSRLMTAKLKLNYEDFINLKFNDRLWIKNAWWRILKIKDYILGETTICEIEFIKIGKTLYTPSFESISTEINIDIKTQE